MFPKKILAKREFTVVGPGPSTLNSSIEVLLHFLAGDVLDEIEWELISVSTLASLSVRTFSATSKLSLSHGGNSFGGSLLHNHGLFSSDPGVPKEANLFSIPS
jgi:hypothetical protein